MQQKRLLWGLGLLGAGLLIGIVLLITLANTPETASEESASSQQKQALNWKVDDFTYTDQNGKPFGRSDLEGQVWIADLIFTNCNTVCPPMTANMAQLQEKMKESGVEAEIVSFSIDPKRDTPEALKRFGKKHEAEFSNWHFLTGYSFEEIQQFAESSFRMTVRHNPENDQVIHGTSFYLIGPDGRVLHQYNGMNPDYEEIIRDIRSARQ
ncbi:protein SCO1/2 [Melghirimyces profundicolus]|uniref:Protein SCO1/2 n=1 Tax=Melghirimyces profundicolus TaxID=1242148 RepID=A0A2T6BV99_9BACL|nr:SCO family protein [Melghirimyces profundicolus]PTX59972.1 protein SCO1/2 [Melghirimyces profundicolus]